MKIARRMILCSAFLLAQSVQAQCRDPWVTEEVKAYKQVHGLGSMVIGRGETGECNINLYGANWSSREQLREQIRRTYEVMRQNGFRWKSEWIISDLKMFNTLIAPGHSHYKAQAYFGPASAAPRDTSNERGQYGYWYVYPIANNYVLAFQRRCSRACTPQPTACTCPDDRQ